MKIRAPAGKDSGRQTPPIESITDFNGSCQEFLPGALTRLRTFYADYTANRASDGKDGNIGIDLVLDHVLDRHQRAGQRAGAAPARALVADLQRGILKSDHLQPAAVAGKVGPNAVVKQGVYLGDLRVVVCRRGYRSTDCRGGPVPVPIRTRD